MSFWSGETIQEKAEGQAAELIKPFSKKQIDCASYTLLMGNEAYVTINGNGLQPPYGDKLILSDGQILSIPPGQFAFLLTHESLCIPKDVLGFISLKSTKKYRGLVNVSGFHVDPGFQGKLIFAVYNAGPTLIRIMKGDELFLIWFANLDRKDTKENRIDRGKSPQVNIGSNLIQNIPGQPVTLQSVASDLKSIETQLKIIYGVVGAMVIVITLLFSFMAVDWGGWYSYFHSTSESAVQHRPSSAMITSIENTSTSPSQARKP